MNNLRDSLIKILQNNSDYLIDSNGDHVQCVDFKSWDQAIDEIIELIEFIKLEIY